jgi:hypothetical protein
MKKIKIWHTIKHDDYTTTEVPFNEKLGMFGMVKKFMENGGFSADGGWVPWIRVSYVELIEE